MADGCSYCGQYDRLKQNYCRICGTHLTAGQMQRPERPIPYDVPERFCGHCGSLLSECSGDHDDGINVLDTVGAALVPPVSPAES